MTDTPKPKPKPKPKPENIPDAQRRVALPLLDELFQGLFDR